VILKELGRFKEAEENYKKAITLKPDYAEAHCNLGILLYANSKKDLALASIQKSNELDPNFRVAAVLLAVLKARRTREEGTVCDTLSLDKQPGLILKPLIQYRGVEPSLVTKISEMNSRSLNNTTDARYGSGKCSLNFRLFEDPSPIIKKLATDLRKIMMEAVQSDIYIFDSFFNILNAGGTTPHTHLNKLDRDVQFNIGEQKYSLVYYLSVGDQNCSEPGILKLDEPAEDILPSNGKIVIIPANRLHSAVYGGKTDRIMVGANFYRL